METCFPLEDCRVDRVSTWRRGEGATIPGGCVDVEFFDRNGRPPGTVLFETRPVRGRRAYLGGGTLNPDRRVSGCQTSFHEGSGRSRQSGRPDRVAPLGHAGNANGED